MEVHVALSHFGANSLRAVRVGRGEALDKRWKQLAKQYHPDRMKDERDKAEATRRWPPSTRPGSTEAPRKFEMQSKQESDAASRGASSTAFTSGATSANSNALAQGRHQTAAPRAPSSSASAHVPAARRGWPG